MTLLAAEEAGEKLDELELAREVGTSVRDVVRRQVAAGIDVINDGEHSKMSFTTYTAARLGGLERTSSRSDERRAHPRLAAIRGRV